MKDTCCSRKYCESGGRVGNEKSIAKEKQENYGAAAGGGSHGGQHGCQYADGAGAGRERV